MATTARLGVDIIGRDRTRSAFGAVQRSMDGLNRSMRTIKAGLAGFAGGNILANVIRSFVEINRTSEPVATAINQMQRAWQAFALEVGAAGLNQGLIDFARRMGALLIGTEGLSQSIGRFLGGAVRVMATIFEGIGRAIAFAYDNGRIFIKVFATLAALNIASRIIAGVRSFVLLISALKAASLATALFHIVSRRSLVVWAGAAAIFAYTTGTLEDLQQAMGWVWEQAEALIPTIDSGVSAALKRMGFDVTALTTDLGALQGELAGLPPLFADIATSSDVLSKPLNIVPQGIEDGTRKLTQMQQAAIDVGEAFKGWVTDLRAGASVMDSIRNMIDALATKFLDQAFAFLLPSQAPGGGFNAGGILSALQGAFAGGFASGGSVPAGKWGVMGEKGPEPVIGPATVLPNSALGGSKVDIKIINQGGISSTQTRRESGGREMIEIVNRVVEGRFPELMMKNAPLIGGTPASKRLG